jgi:hypothetical protein
LFPGLFGLFLRKTFVLELLSLIAQSRRQGLLTFTVKRRQLEHG